MKTLLLFLFIVLPMIGPGEANSETPPIIPENNNTITTEESNTKAILISSSTLEPYHSISDYVERDYRAEWMQKLEQTTDDTPTKLANQLIKKKHNFVVILGESQSGKTVALKRIQHILHAYQTVETWSVLVDLPEIVPTVPPENWQAESIFSTALSPDEYSLLTTSIIPEKPDKLYLFLDNIDRVNFKTMPALMAYIDSLIKKGVRVVITKTQKNIYWSTPKVQTVEIPPLTLSEIKKYLTEHWDAEFGPLTHYKHVDYANAVVKFFKAMKIRQNFGTIKRLKELLSSDSINIFTGSGNFVRINDYVHGKTFNPAGLEEMFGNMQITRRQLLEALSAPSGHVKKLFPPSSNLVTTPRPSPSMFKKLNSTAELGKVEKNTNLSSSQSPAVNNDRKNANEQLGGLKTPLKRDILFRGKPSLIKFQTIIAETSEKFLTRDFCNDLLFLAINEGDWRQMQPVIIDLKHRCASPSTIIVRNETLVHVALRKRDFELLEFVVKVLRVPMEDVSGTKSLFITALDVNPLTLYSSPSFWKIMKYFIEFGVVQVPQPSSAELNYSKVKPTAKDISSPIYKLFTDVSNKENSNQTFPGISWEEVDKLSPGLREYRRNLVLTRGLSKYSKKSGKDNTTLLEVLLKYRSIEILDFSEEMAYRNCIYLALWERDIRGENLTYEQEFRIGRALVDSIGTLIDLKFVLSFLSDPGVLSHWTHNALNTIILRLVERMNPEEKFAKLPKRSLEAGFSQTRAKYYSTMGEPSMVIEEFKRFGKALQAQRAKTD